MPAAEAALVPLLKSDDPVFVLAVADLLEKINGPRTAALLAELSRTSPNPDVREYVARKLAARVGK